MNSSTTTGGHHWSHLLRLLAPGPLGLGMRAYVDPTAWGIIWTSRRNARPYAGQDVVARRTGR